MHKAAEAPVSFRPPGEADWKDAPSSLPREFQRDVRSRVQLLSLFMLVAFGFDLVIFLVKWFGSSLGYDLADAVSAPAVQWANAGVVSMSAVLWWFARSASASAAQLHAFGLIYQVIVCFVIAAFTNWQFHLEYGVLPHLTWVPAIVILFPLILPGPPRRMLAGAIAAGAMSPLALLVLQLFGGLPVDTDAYVQAIVSSAFGVAFANIGARIIYGLGREVAAAREMGSYHLEHKLGQGGMGEVWKARHRMLARPAAVKLIRPPQDVAWSGFDDDARRRFEREAQATAQLRSPHTVELFDFGVADDGTIYYVMELLEGMDAHTLVQRFGPMPAERAMHLLGQVCHSLSEAESCGLVHRDIKPANIFICKYGQDYDFVKVLDFGLVKAFGTSPAAAAETLPALTRQDIVTGTPAFMAPEQAMGLADLDGRADIYSVGCVAYWLLTGHHVFPADSLLGQIVQHQQQTPAPPSRRAPGPVPAAMDDLVLACLAKAPGDRPQSARELSQRLARLPSESPWTGAQAHAWWSAADARPTASGAAGASNLTAPPA